MEQRNNVKKPASMLNSSFHSVKNFLTQRKLPTVVCIFFAEFVNFVKDVLTMMEFFNHWLKLVLNH